MLGKPILPRNENGPVTAGLPVEEVQAPFFSHTSTIPVKRKVPVPPNDLCGRPGADQGNPFPDFALDPV
jgi:hypothetical protein